MTWDSCIKHATRLAHQLSGKQPNCFQVTLLVITDSIHIYKQTESVDGISFARVPSIPGWLLFVKYREEILTIL